MFINFFFEKFHQITFIRKYIAVNKKLAGKLCYLMHARLLGRHVYQEGQSISIYISQRSNIKKVVKTGAGENNVHFRHLLGILKLAWYLKSRFVGTHRCCQQRHTALTALQAALFGATQVSPPNCTDRSTFGVPGQLQYTQQMAKMHIIFTGTRFDDFFNI